MMVARKRALIETFQRKRLDRNRIFGVAVAESEELLLIHQEFDFLFDGFVVVRQRDVTRRLASEANAHCMRLMRQERLWSPVPRWVRSLPLDGWQALLGALVGRIVIIENESRNDFFIGPLLGVDARRARIRWFDGCGRLGAVEHVRLDRVTAVRIATRYAEIHGRHLSEPTT